MMYFCFKALSPSFFPVLLGAKWFWHSTFPFCLSRASTVANGCSKEKSCDWVKTSSHAALPPSPQIPVNWIQSSPCIVRGGENWPHPLCHPASSGLMEVLGRNYRKRWCESCPHPCPPLALRSCAWLTACPQTTWNHSRGCSLLLPELENGFLNLHQVFRTKGKRKAPYFFHGLNCLPSLWNALESACLLVLSLT